MTRALRPLTGKAEVKRQNKLPRLHPQWEEETEVNGEAVDERWNCNELSISFRCCCFCTEANKQANIRAIMSNCSKRTKKKKKERDEERCHGSESSPCILTQYPRLSPKIIERKARGTAGGKGKILPQQADVSSGPGLD